MSKNILSDVSWLYDEIIDNGTHKTTSGDTVPYEETTKKSFLDLVAYIKECPWTEVETTRFVAYHFRLRQSQLAEAWERSQDHAPKSASTFRVQTQNINHYLSNLLAENWTDAFILEDVKQIAEISKMVKALRMNDKQMESEFGEALMGQLRKLPLTSAKFTPQECVKELETLKELSECNGQEMLNRCDAEKLSYTVDMLTSPSLVKGSLNEKRFDFVKAYTSQPVKESIVKRAVSAYASGVSITDGMTVNEELLSYLSSIMTVKGVLKGLERFSKTDVAYVYSELEKGNREVLNRLLK